MALREAEPDRTVFGLERAMSLPGRGHAKLFAHEVYRIGVRVNPVRDGSEYHRSFFANQVATFRENSTSIRRRLLSSRRRSNSARSLPSSG
jgi:hypothetical protein